MLVPSVFVRAAVAKTRQQPTSYLSPFYRKREVDELANGEFGVQIPVTRQPRACPFGFCTSDGRESPPTTDKLTFPFLSQKGG